MNILKEVSALINYPFVVYNDFENKNSEMLTKNEPMKSARSDNSCFLNTNEKWNQENFIKKYSILLQQKALNQNIDINLHEMFKTLVKLTLCMCLKEFLLIRNEYIDDFCLKYSNVFLDTEEKQKFEKLLKSIEELFAERVEELGISSGCNKNFTVNYGLNTPKRMFREYYEFWQYIKISFLKHKFIKEKVIPFKKCEMNFLNQRIPLLESYLEKWVVNQFSFQKKHKRSISISLKETCQDTLFLYNSNVENSTNMNKETIQKKVGYIKNEMVELEKERLEDMKDSDDTIEKLKDVINKKR